MKKLLFYILALINLVLIIGFWWGISGQQLLLQPQANTVLIILGRLAGLLAVYFILQQFLIIGRVKWLEKHFGFDKLAAAHKWFGFIGFWLIIIHFSFLLLGYAQAYQITLAQQFISFNLQWDDLLPATPALLLFILIVALSISWSRKRVKYETWYYVHLLSYLAIVLAFGHQLELGHDLRRNQIFADYWVLLYIFVFANFIYYRFLYQALLFYKQRFYVSEIRPETSDTVSIYMKGNNIKNFKYKPGQFIILRFLHKGLWWQAHPYSISCLPNNEFIRITAKALGDFSSQLSQIPISTKVIIDGPAGVFTAKDNLDKVLLIGLGVGITPIRVLAEQLAAQGKNIILLYSAKTQADFIFKAELDQIQSQYQQNFFIHYITSEEENKYNFSLINQPCLQCLVPDLKDRGVYLCGPPQAMQAIEKELRQIGLPKKKIYYEKFSL